MTPTSSSTSRCDRGRRWRWWPRAAVLLAITCGVRLPAQSEPLAHQERAKARFEALRNSMQRVQLTLAEAAPDDSSRLRSGTQHIQEAQILERMQQIQELLRNSRWDEALEQMAAVQVNLEHLLDLLLAHEADLQPKLDERARLQDFVRRIDQLLAEQRAEAAVSTRTAALPQQLDALAKAQTELARLVAAQQSVRDQAGNASADEAQRLAPQERELAAAVAELAVQLQPLTTQQPSAATHCQGASAAMRDAAQQLGQQPLDPALASLDAALRQLREAEAALRRIAEDCLREQHESGLATQAQQQAATCAATDRLALDMAQSASEQGQVPGTANVQQAVPSQHAATAELRQSKPDRAAPHQRLALDQLEQAKEQLESAAAECRQQVQSRVLQALAQRLGAMLLRQQELSAMTLATDKLRAESLAGDGQLPAALVARCQEISQGERALAADGQAARQLLEQEGSTAVLPELLAKLHADLEQVAVELGRGDTGTTIQQQQAKIIATLQMLIDAIRNTIDDQANANANSKNSQGNGKPSLVPISAELQLLLALQQDVYAGTVEYDRRIPEVERQTGAAVKEAAGLAGQQSRIEDLTRKLARKLEQSIAPEDR